MTEFKLKWDQDTERLYETGVKNCVLFVKNDNGTYRNGVAWNGITSVSESPSGADETKLYADDRKYLSLRAAEDFGATVEAYMYPDEWMECDGSAKLANGIYVGQQVRRGFALSYLTTVGNDAQGDSFGEKLHIIYNAMASPSEKSYSTINDSPEAISFSWSITTTPVSFGTGLRDSATLTIDSTKLDDRDPITGVSPTFDAIKEKLYGVANGSESELPTPEWIIALVGSSSAVEYVYEAVESPASGSNPYLSDWYTRSGAGTTSDPYVYEHVPATETSVNAGTTYYDRYAKASSSQG